MVRRTPRGCPPSIFTSEYNQLGGSIPTELGLLTTLKKMDLGMNGRIGGSIPSQLCGLTNLQELFLNSNDLNGQLPNCLDRLTALKIIQLADNDLTGKLSSRLCHLTQMELLSIEGNMISGRYVPMERRNADLLHHQYCILGMPFLSFFLDSLLFIQHTILHGNVDQSDIVKNVR